LPDILATRVTLRRRRGKRRSMDIPGGHACELCGSGPAKVVSIRRHVGMLILQKFVKVRRPVCRDCGMRLLRSFTLKTLWQGWWGYISFFVNWFVLAANLRAYFGLRGLAQPRPSAGQTTSSAQWQSAYATDESRD
jgi:hypothetical protein